MGQNPPRPGIRPQNAAQEKAGKERQPAKKLILAVFLQYYSSKALLCGRLAHRITVTGRDSACLWLNEILPGADSASDSVSKQAQNEPPAPPVSSVEDRNGGVPEGAEE